MEMSSSSSTSSITACFDSSLDEIRSDFHNDSVRVRIMTTLYLCAKNRWSNHFSYLESECEESNCESLGCNLFFRIKEAVCRHKCLRSDCLTSYSDDEEEEVNSDDEEDVVYGDDEEEEVNSDDEEDVVYGDDEEEVVNIDEDMVYGDDEEKEVDYIFLVDKIYICWNDSREELCLLLDEHCLVGVPTVGQLMDLIDYLLDLVYRLLFIVVDVKYGLDIFEALREKLMLCKKFISFFTMQGVDHVQLIELLIAVESVAVKTARLICMYSYNGYGDLSEISQMLQKFKPVDPHVRETCIHVLTSLKSSRSSSDILLTLGNNWQILAADFLDSLLGNLWDLLDYDATGFIISVKDQMHKLNGGVKFLRYLLREHQEKFNTLHDKMKDLIRVVVYDVGIVICSLSPSEMTEGLPKETNNALFHLLEVLEFIMAEVSLFYPSVSFPRTNELGSIDFLLKNIKELSSCETDSIAFLKDQIHRVQEDLVFLRYFLQTIAEQRNQNDRLQGIWNRVMEVAYKAEYVIDSAMVGDKPDCSSMSLETITEEIEFLKIEAHEIYDRMRHYIQPQRVAKDSIRMPSHVSTPALNEYLVDLDDQVDAIISRLESGSKKLDIVPIVGMPGLGKTTLATKVHHNLLNKRHFHVHAWCTVSQVYRKHDLLVQILRCTVRELHKNCLGMTEDDLADQLYKNLKGNRYLIVLDDVWDVDTLNSLKVSFPDDVNGSRILFTSRFHDLSLQIKPDSEPHCLRHFTDEESWALLQNKLFGKEGCPSALSADGMQIAKNCKGLPLTVAIVAGILAGIEQDCWKDVANSLSLSTVIGTEHCMKSLELSYSHLPDYLKPCLLYFGAFQEDREIPVRKLIMLWISEGFVQKAEEKKLEDVADEYFMDLFGRSLVTVTHQRTTGGAKTCRIHDLLHEFCVAKAKEERFLQIFHGHNEIFTCNRLYNPHRLCIYSKGKDFIESRLFFPRLRCLLLVYDSSHVWREDPSLIFRVFKLLRVLDLLNIRFGDFPKELVLLVHLRYLALDCFFSSIPSSISDLSMLETLILRPFISCVDLPSTIWKLKKLRHLCAVRRVNRLAGFRFSTDNLEVVPDLYDLDSLTLEIDPSLQNIEKIMRKLPSIRRLKCAFMESDFSACNYKGIFVLDYLSRLESLSVDGFYGIECTFPLNLKKLTLSYCSLPWSEISTIGKLPNLEVLKLLRGSFLGETWEMKEGEFPNLTFLKLQGLDIVRWTAYCDNFPPLQKLVLHDCEMLIEVPSCLGDIETIKMIEVGWCLKSVISSVKQIQDQQTEWGNKDLKIIIYCED